MRGRIKFLDPKTGMWGFIVPEDAGRDAHFRLCDCLEPRPSSADADKPVEFELVEDAQGRHARNVRLLEPPAPATGGATLLVLGDALTTWAYVPFVPFKGRDGRQHASAVALLADIALNERWFFGDQPNPANPWPVLENYLTYTFLKLQREGNIVERASKAGTYAAFNTGLVDRLYDRIFALFESNPRPGYQKWRFCDFCVPGKGPSGKKLTSVFEPLPPAPTYFTSNFDMLLDTTKDIHVDHEHVILDAVARDRFPAAFLRQNSPRGVRWQEFPAMPGAERSAFLARVADAFNDDVQCLRGIKNRLEDATVLAEKRTKWNFKTAIPQYYPRHDIMSLLLPLCLTDDTVVDIALVVTRNPSGSYQGRTVLPLPWAYKNARLVSRPDSDWLTPNMIPPEEDRPEEEGEQLNVDNAV
jgi:cold shock CspA family protein